MTEMIVNSKTCLNMDKIQKLSCDYDVPKIDILFIAVNRDGLFHCDDIPRSRMQVKPKIEKNTNEMWQIILPLDNPASPFRISDKEIYLEDEHVIDVVNSENDDVVLTYLRAGGKSITLNTYSRSSCVGCVFCPNIIEDAADDVVNGINNLKATLKWLCFENNWADLQHVDIITVCSGCFKTSKSAIQHMSDLREASSLLGFTGKLHLLSSVIREKKDLKLLHEKAGPFHLTLTLECFERRSLLLKDSKASLTLDDTCRILDDCDALGITGDFTYVLGLDNQKIAVDGLKRLAHHVTTFPRIQVYQAHNEHMKRYANPEITNLEYFLNTRVEIESIYLKNGLKPVSWQNYRPIWYSEYNGKPVEGPRV